MCSFLMLEIKSYVSLKNESFPFFFFFGRGYISREGGVKFSKILRGVAHKGGGALTDLDFFWGGT